MLRWLYLLVLLPLLSPLPAWADTRLPLFQPSAAELTSPYPLDHSLLLEDPSGRLDEAQALQALSERGTTVRGSARIGYSTSTWWQTLRLRTPTSEPPHLIVATPFLDHLDVWLFDGERSLGRLQSGNRVPFEARGEPYPQFMLQLPVQAPGTYTLLLRVSSHSSIHLPLQLVDSAHSQTLIAQNWLRSGLLVGALFSLALFYLIRFSTLRETPQAYFSLTALCAAVYNANLYGIAGLALDAPAELWRLLINLSTAGMLIFSSLFLASALQLPMQRLRWLRDPLFAAIALVCIGGYLSDHAQTYRLLNLLIMLAGAYQLLLLLLALRLRRAYAPGYLLCWSAALLLMLLLPLSRAGITAWPTGLHNLNAALPVLSMLMFGALLDKQLERMRRILTHTQAQAIDNLEQYHALFRHSGEGIFRCRRDGQLLEANPSLTFLLGDEVQGSTLQRLLGEATWHELLAELDRAGGALSRECQLHDLQGRAHWVYLSLHQQPAQACIEGIVVDLNERRALEERLQHQATHDALTGLRNRRELERLLSQTLSGQGPQRFSHLLCLGLDRFKQVNDLSGHLAGDQLLRQVAQQLGHTLPTGAELARIGGDEFAILLQAEDTAMAMQQAQQLRQSIEQFVFTWQCRPFRLNASIGLLALDSGVSDWETALNWASNAAQLAKHQGRNRVHAFNPADGALLEHQRQLQWIIRLREATEQDHFELFYQPLQPLQQAQGGLHYEVLLRYRDPHSGEWISPSQFLDAAARYGFLGAIDRWVIDRLCAWLAANPQHLQALEQVNINLSADSLLDPSFHALLRDTLHRHALPAAKLCIEITEMVALGELGVSAKSIEELRRQGLKVALDDFGSGFASYAYLRQLPLDILKIDGSFIRGIEEDPINQAMVGSMQQIAAQLGLQTVAEFVETQQSLECLRALGIDHAQGYHVGRPQPLAQLADRT